MRAKLRTTHGTSGVVPDSTLPGASHTWFRRTSVRSCALAPVSCRWRELSHLILAADMQTTDVVPSRATAPQSVNRRDSLCWHFGPGSLQPVCPFACWALAHQTRARNRRHRAKLVRVSRRSTASAVTPCTDRRTFVGGTERALQSHAAV